MFEDHECKGAMTFGEFMSMTEKYPNLILPAGYKTIESDCVGVIETQCFRPLVFTTDAAQSIVKSLKEELGECTMNNDFVFFWGNRSVFSQWHKKDMVIAGKTFCCCEQYMMFCKAMLFSDYLTAEKIMLTNNPKEHKALGRQVKNFNEKVWDDACRDIVYTGNLAKFSQNEDLKKILLSTESKELVEASPYDRIWGVGLAENDPRINDKTKWLGSNWLGEALMMVRDTIRNR